MAALDLPAGVAIDGAIVPGLEKVLTPEAIAFVADLQRRFNPRREELLAARAARQERLDAGEKPDFLAETAGIRESDWAVASLPASSSGLRPVMNATGRKMTTSESVVAMTGNVTSRVPWIAASNGV